MTDQLRLLGDSRSGNCYKILLACAELGIDCEWQEIDILAGDTHTKEFLAMNPNGKIPLLVINDKDYLPESNAILSYLADGHALAGRDRLERGRVQSWMCYEQYSHEPFIATSRFIIKYQNSPPERQAELEGKRDGGYKALDIMEQTLTRQAYFAGDRYTIADIALFAYTQVADEGGFDLARYAAINGWMDRIRQRPAFVPMAESV